MGLFEGFQAQLADGAFVFSQGGVHLGGRLFHLGNDLPQAFHDRVEEVGDGAQIPGCHVGAHGEIAAGGPFNISEQVNQLQLQGFLFLAALFG